MEGAGGGLKTAFDNAVAHIHGQQKYTPEMLADKPITALINETNKILASPLTDNVVPEAMLSKLQKDVFVFSGCKTHLQLREVSNLLLDGKGKIKSFNQFSQEVQAIHKTYNVQYLEAEHIFATSSAESAARWSEYEADGDRYDLQYRTASDDRVRDDHAALHNTTLPADDPFWSNYFPPNGWRCRCVAVQVRKGKFERSNSKEAIAKGEKATTQIGKDGQNRAEIFRFNPGKQAVIFPPNHPYSKVKEGVKGIINSLYEKAKEKVISYDPHDIGELHKIPEYRQALKTVQYNKLTDKFPNLTEDELASIRYYSIDGYEELNQNLWKGKSMKSTNSLEKVLNTALSKLPKDNNQVYYRGVGLPKDIIDQYDYHWKKDLVKTEKAFTSTSLDVNVAEKMQVTLQNEHRVMFILNGKNGRNITEISHYLDKEKEVLFQSKLQVKVENVELKNGYYEIMLKEID